MLYGKNTELAIGNFTVSGQAVPIELIHALALVKRAAAMVNAEHEELTGVTPSMATAIASAAEAVSAGHHDDQFPVDVFQTGSGTSSNMNVNEVIATIARERLGSEVHPNDHVNASQSTNDTFPTAIRITCLRLLTDGLVPALRELVDALGDRALAFASVVKAGRTHMMDATPITLGQEFSGYAAQMRSCIERIERSYPRLGALAIGGSATGNGLNTPPGFGSAMCDRLSQATGLSLTEAVDHFAAQGAQDDLVELSGHLRSTAVALIKIADDIRLMASGPRTGLAELTLPSLQPGSSIMPGKVNPVICEVVTQVGAQVMGNDCTVAFAGSQGALELNTYLPVMALNLVESIHLSTNASRSFARDCIAGIEADADRCRVHAESTPALGTALNRHVGYDTAADIVRESLATDRPIREIVLDRRLLTTEQLDQILDVERLARGDNNR